MNRYLIKLKNILKFKYIFLFFVIILSFVRIKTFSKYNINDTTFTGIVESYEYKSNYLTFILRDGNERLKCNYYLKDYKGIKIDYGDKLELTGVLKTPNNNTIPNLFNYKKYLNNNNIFYILEIKEIIKKDKTNSMIYIVKNHIQRSIDYDTTGYLKALIIGDKSDIDEESYNSFKDNGILHIFSISGMHISFLAMFILFILNKIKKSDNNIMFVIIFLIFYLFITNFQPSIFRSVLFFSLLKIFRLLKMNLSNIDILIISLIIILLIIPNYIYNIGFLYSSIISYSLLFFNNNYKNNYFLNILKTSILCFLVSLPITININYSINLLSIFINLIFIPLITFIIYPITIITFIIRAIYPVFRLLIDITEKLSILISNIKLFNVTIPKLNYFMISIYYILIYLIYKIDKKYIILLIAFILIIRNISFFDNTYYVYYLDVSQGDMIVLKKGNNVSIIDTGGLSYKNDYSLTQKYITFFNSIGVDKIERLIITHGDYDHMGEAINLVENFKVEKVIFNCGHYNDLEQELIKVLDKKKIKHYSCIKELNIDKNKLYFLQTKEYDNENDNSNVIYTELNGYKFMFMGDAGIVKEKDILDKYNISDIDVLKIGHHGSKTSSSKEFIDEINPRYSIISVGKNNRYGHPNKDVLKTLEDSKIYRTDKDGSIMFIIKNNRLKIETCSP